MAGYCNEQGIKHVGQSIMKPAYLGFGLPNYSNPSYINNYITSMPLFTNNMWNGWNNSKCEYWPNRVMHWTSQIDNNPNLSKPTTNAHFYQLGRKKAKIVFAKTMFIECRCSGIPFMEL